MRKVFGLALGISATTGAVWADGHGAAPPALFLAETCLRSADAAFETSLDAADPAPLREIYGTATFECLGLAMEMCERGEDEGASVACLEALAAWVEAQRAQVVARLPDAIEGGEGYGGALERARAGADAESCAEMTEVQRTRYCAVVSHGVALEDAYHAWREARRVGAVPLEGHRPVILEGLQ